MRIKTWAAGKPGYLLLEALIATTIVALISLVITSTVSLVSKNNQSAASRQISLLHARSLLAAAGYPPIDQADNRGKFEDSFQWRVNLVDVTPNKEQSGERILSVAVEIVSPNGRTFGIDSVKRVPRSVSP